MNLENGEKGACDGKSELWPLAAPPAIESRRHLFFVRCLFTEDDFVVDFSRGELAFN